MTEEYKPVSYLKMGEKGRYICTVCGESVATIFCDLGCDNCGGNAFTEHYEGIRDQLEDAIFSIENEDSLTDEERERLRGMMEEALEK